MTVAEALRGATEASHRALDGGLRVVERLTVAADRVELLRGYHAMHGSAEAAMAGLLGPELDFTARRRAPLIARGLAELGAELGAAPAPLPAFALGCRAEALGVLYVMEGSTLGGRLILRGLRERGADTAGLGFLDPYGAHVGAMWRALLEALERELANEPAEQALAVAGARAGFAHAGRCLSGSAVRGRLRAGAAC